MEGNVVNKTTVKNQSVIVVVARSAGQLGRRISVSPGVPPPMPPTTPPVRDLPPKTGLRTALSISLKREWTLDGLVS